MLTEKDLIKGQLYKIVLQHDLEHLVKERYKYYYYEGVVTTSNWFPFLCFVPKIKKYKHHILPLFIKSDPLFENYEYREGNCSISYYFITDAYIDTNTGRIISPPINDEEDCDVRYDMLYFNIINP